MDAVKTVIDTNILVSALWSKDSKPSKIVNMLPDGKLIPCFCEEILFEYRTVLLRPSFGFNAAKVTNCCQRLLNAEDWLRQIKAFFLCRTRTTVYFTTLQRQAAQFLLLGIQSISRMRILL